jgi:hypothetical protein
MKIHRTNPLNSIRQEAVLQMVFSAPPVFLRETEFLLWRLDLIPRSDFNAVTMKEMRSPKTPQKAAENINQRTEQESTGEFLDRGAESGEGLVVDRDVRDDKLAGCLRYRLKPRPFCAPARIKPCPFRTVLGIAT